ncbi:hypothetical protein [Planobispora takensis]|uniref:Uncharacterized protein n=1 Tax=Planobispora takensis TaxID=1367882 RepID=A0A8J3SSC8_9ACTN|nr:hypothetical protein [Planobispora takensis]GIH99352.1 hypothetical protein Pta02_13610 [Planobispora takensis]
MSTRHLLNDLAAICYPEPAFPEEDQTPPAERDAARAGTEEARAAFLAQLAAAEEGSGPDFDPLLNTLGNLVAIKKDADEKIRLLLAYGRIYTTPRPHTLEALGQAAGLTPSGVSRAFGAEEILQVGDRTGLRPAAADVSDHHPELFPEGTASQRRCTWGGSRTNPCTDAAKYIVTDKSGTRWACCDSHLPGYLRSRPRA